MVVEDFGVDPSDDFPASFNIAPGQKIPIIKEDPAGSLLFTTHGWGFPSVTGGADSKPKFLINARLETVALKPSFKVAWKNHRCLVLAEAYYEWPAPTGGKTGTREPYLVTLDNGRPFVMAGLFKAGGLGASYDRNSTEQPGVVIVTTSARPDIDWLHSRMPLIMTPKRGKAWLRGDDAILSSVGIETTPVSSYVNRVSNNGPRCIEAVRGLFD